MKKKGSYIMKGIPGDLWHDCKVKAAQQDTSLKEVILRLLKQWLQATEKEER